MTRFFKRPETVVANGLTISSIRGFVPGKMPRGSACAMPVAGGSVTLGGLTSRGCYPRRWRNDTGAITRSGCARGGVAQRRRAITVLMTHSPVVLYDEDCGLCRWVA